MGEFEAKISDPAPGQSPRSQHATKTAARGGAEVAQNHATPVKCLALPTGALFGRTAGAADPPRPRGGWGHGQMPWVWPEPPILETGHLGVRIPRLDLRLLLNSLSLDGAGACKAPNAEYGKVW